MTKLNQLKADKIAAKIQGDLEDLETQVGKCVVDISAAGDAVAASVVTLVNHKNADGTPYFDAADKKQVYDKLKAIKPHLIGLMSQIDAITAPTV